MRLHLKLTRNKDIVPFNYQEKLVSIFHQWLGKDNEYHNNSSFYSMSWLSDGRQKGNGLDFPQGTTWFISAYKDELLKKLLKGIKANPDIGFGIIVNEVIIQADPKFSSMCKFVVASPILIKERVEGSKNAKFYYYNEPKSNDLLTQSLQNKLKKVGISDERVKIEFDRDYHTPKIKKVKYKGIDNKGSVCPVIIKGSPEQIAFAWNVGVGNSTGIGFGALI